MGALTSFPLLPGGTHAEGSPGQSSATMIYPPNISGKPKAFPGPGDLFVGTCYQPIDRTPEQIKADIAIMRKAGFNVVRMGDLSWDSFEPAEEKFEFGWSDRILDQMHEAGIRVVLDIPGSPAPIWLHRKYPGVDIVNEQGNRVPPAERYIDDISDPDYRRCSKQLAEAMLQRYAKHPAIIAVGYDNEIGHGYMSYSEATRLRFIEWLRRRYGTIESLNKAWATQRWSRRLSSFDDVDLPLKSGPGPAERYLDLHRYWSDVTIDHLLDLEAVRLKHMPEIPTLSNLWDYSGRRGFDYLSTYKRYVSFGAMGFYAGGPVDGSFQIMMTKGAVQTPTWLNEFTAGGGGWYGDPGRSRMLALSTLLVGAQGVLAWTFNSHSGGEEQALFGLVDHDGQPSWKVDEWAQIAKDFRVLSKFGFPRYFKPEIAIAYSFEAAVSSAPNGPSNTTRQYFKTGYYDQVMAAFEPLYKKNIDAAIINIGHENLKEYKLVVVPALYLMDEAAAKAIRDYVSNGGTVLMTGYSAKINENAQWFESTLPGRLSDVFGLRTAGFYRNDQGVSFTLEGKSFDSKATYYELLEPRTATELGTITNSYLPSHFPSVTVNKFGKGHAYYLATESTASSMGPILDLVRKTAGVSDGPTTPEGVYARVVDGRTFYVNSNWNEVSVPVSKPCVGLLSGKHFTNEVSIPAKGAELVEVKKL
ncbi:MAG: beta-galactosidase [Armatimonadetes bacterium]|nr:beta-galactosidase [Armatimonadota bacterium]